MATFPEIPAGFAIPLVDTTTKLFPAPTMGALGDAFIPRAAPSIVLELADFLLTGESLAPFQSGAVECAPLVQRALDFMGAQYLADGIPRAVHVPAGRYKQETRFVPPLKGGFGIIGDGRGATRFISGPDNQHMAPYGDPNAGGWDPDNPAMTYYKECYFADYTFDANNHVIDAWGSGNKKMYAMGHIKDSTWYRVRAIGTHSTAFGTDYNEGNTYQECSAINCGRGMFLQAPDTRVGAGSGFGIASGAFVQEKTTLINCVATGCGANGFFFEQQSRKESYRKSAGFEMIGCWAIGNTFGITDAGGMGAIVADNYILDNTLDGFRLAGTQTGFQGGVEGACRGNFIRGNGRAGISVGGSADGGYAIHDNVCVGNGTGFRVEPNATVGRGLRIYRNRLIDNAGPGASFETVLPIAGLDFSDNDIRGNGYGLGAAYTDGITVLGTLIKPNIRRNRVTNNKGKPLALRGTTVTTIAPRILDNDFDVSPGGDMLLEHVIADSSKVTGNLGNAAATVTNAITNPHPYVDATGWTNLNGTVSTVPTGGRRLNDNVRQIVASNGGPKIASPAVTVAAGQIWQGSIWAKGPIGTSLRAEVWHHAVVVTGPKVKATGDWQRISYIDVVPAGVTALRIGVGGTDYAVGQILVADDAMLNQGGDLWPYFDGTFPGCAWSGTVNASTSVFTIPTTDGGAPAPTPTLPATYKNLTTTPVPRVGSTGQVTQAISGPVRNDTGGPFANGYLSATTTASNPKFGTAALAVTEGQVYNVSCYMKGPVGASLRAEAWHSAATVPGTAVLANGGWQRVSFVTTIPAGVTVLRAGGGGVSFPVGVEVQFAAFQITAGADLLPYVDGAQPSCVWDGTAYASASTWNKP